MKYIPSYSDDPADNLAYEHYLLTRKVTNEPLLFFYINKPSVIIGRHQNAYEQVNLEYVWREGIPVIRRMSGGGAVYHDYGNLNYSFILPNDKQMLDFKSLTKPILEALQAMGINAELSGRNDLEIDEKKFSGTAMYKKNGHLLIHGTLLYQSDLTRLNDILKVKAAKIESKGVKSVRARVTNLAPYLESKRLTTEEFKSSLKEKIPNLCETSGKLAVAELKEINKIKAEYYGNQKWNLGRIADWSYQNYKRFSFGEIEVAIKLEQSIVVNFKLYGDYFATNDITNLEAKFMRLPYNRQVFSNILDQVNLKNYLPQLTKQEFLNLCFDN